MKGDFIPLDYKVIYQAIESGARVLDLGCGSGELIYLLAKEKNAKVQGIEWTRRPSTSVWKRA
jgi:cyclopropane fatty-acyl-phospholipid synthase-like methyltransferase